MKKQSKFHKKLFFLQLILFFFFELLILAKISQETLFGFFCLISVFSSFAIWYKSTSWSLYKKKLSNLSTICAFFIILVNIATYSEILKNTIFTGTVSIFPFIAYFLALPIFVDYLQKTKNPFMAISLETLSLFLFALISSILILTFSRI